MYRSSGDGIRAALGTGLALAVLAPATQAQQAPAQQQTALSDVVVTGSRILRVEGQAPTVSIVSIAAEELNDQGDIQPGRCAQ